MWRFLVLTCFTVPWVGAQNGRNQRPFDNGYGWDIRLAVPGEPGNDYPILNSIPRTSFTCSGKEPGYYADVETNCQVFRVCTFGATYGYQSFLCPNGTLFNQAVFVCDWWMKVNCKKSEDLFKINNDKYGNLKLGPQFMTDIKKMITHPMRSPYDDIYTKSKVVMQEYKPPSNQLYNGISLSNSNRSPNNAYFQTKLNQKYSFQDIYSTADIERVASTPSTQYIPNFNIFQTTNKNAEFIQKNKYTKPYVLPNRIGNLKNDHTGFILNGHTGQTSKAKNFDLIDFSKNIQSIRPTQVYQRSIQNTQNSKSSERLRDVSTDTHEQKIFNNSRLNKQIEFGIEFSKQQLNRKIKQDKLTNKNAQLQNSKYVEIKNETNENLVSNDRPSAIIAKTLAFRRIIKDSTNGNPKSRITFKTWIVRPSRNSKIIVVPTPYTYDKPKNYVEKIIADDISKDNALNITTSNVETTSDEDSYVYNVPTIKLSEQILTTSKETSNLVQTSTLSPEISNLFPTSSPTKPSLLYLIPTTFKPSSLVYIPPNRNYEQISRQYLSPNIENNKLVAVASSPRPFLAQNKNEPSFFLSKQTHINTNHNNLAFSDILTKEKLDITVDDIVKDTNNVLGTASPVEFIEFKNDDQSIIDYPIDNYLYADTDTQSDEKVTLQPPPPLPKNSRLITTPSVDLEPPTEPIVSNNQNNNQIAKLPYFEESTRRPNTIERTVSLKITIPETIAHLLFRNRTISDTENLEILNTGNSNNWVLTNKTSEDNNFNPIGKVIWNKNSNISNSQDLVFSFLIDSINAAKDYNNIVQQNTILTTQPTPTQPQFQSVKNDELQRITNDISKLTSSQFSSLNSSSNYRLANLRALSQSDQNLLNKYKYGSTKLINRFIQNQQANVDQQNVAPLQKLTQKQIQTTVSPTLNQHNIDHNDLTHLDINSDRLYSGQLYQLPVPVISKQIYESLFPGNSKLTDKATQTKTTTEANTVTNSVTKQNTKQINRDINKDVEIIQSQNLDHNTFQPLNSNINAITDQRSAANILADTFDLPKNGITAQVQDNIVGTLPHPLDDDKLIKYKKDQTYFIYTHLNTDDDINTDDIQTIVGNNLANRVFSHNDNLSQLSTYQLIPSINYKLENEKEKQSILNAFQIDENGTPKQISSNEKANQIRRQDTASDIDFTVDHPKPLYNEKPLNRLYEGPNSYSAPQRSVGNLQNNLQGFSNYNSKIEKFDTNDEKSYGYPKISPYKRFIF